ncbi:MAG TPA: RodZ domain-containing protein [Woeseiaceae bacterium]|nr:RodZ domain-containing protein [Woeseiaceae bacterium]
MTDDEERRESDEAAHDGPGPLAGERLALARREKQISVDEIAKELHIDDYKVRALERNDFEVLGAPVFAKGHLRKYAQLVGVRVEDVLADYYSLNRSAGVPPLVGRARLESREINLGRWLVVLLLLVAAGVAWWWFVERDAPARPAATPAGTSRVALPAGETADAAGDTSGDAAGDSPQAAGEPPPASGVADEPGTSIPGAPTPGESTRGEPPADSSAGGAETYVPAAGAAPGGVELAVTYSGDCWTEITDAAGERLFFGLGQAGRIVTVAGEAPLSVLFGNAENVALTVEGAPYAIPAGSRRGQVARLSIQAP